MRRGAERTALSVDGESDRSTRATRAPTCCVKSGGERRALHEQRHQQQLAARGSLSGGVSLVRHRRGERGDAQRRSRLLARARGSAPRRCDHERLRVTAKMPICLSQSFAKSFSNSDFFGRRPIAFGAIFSDAKRREAFFPKMGYKRLFVGAPGATSSAKTPHFLR